VIHEILDCFSENTVSICGCRESYLQLLGPIDFVIVVEAVEGPAKFGDEGGRLPPLLI
jgi:hypothetical protein